MDIYETANKMKIERKTIFDLPLKVTYYARVSTTREEQENSIENQISHFKEMITNNPNWTYIDGYVDMIRGESAKNRPEFMRMIEEGKNGKFDLILTKEVSRFARNTIDSLTYTRELLRSGVGVFFQNDNICTIDSDSELRLTIMSSIAADEVRKLSERISFGQRRAINNGRVLGNSRIYGYDCKDCKLIINEEQAKLVRLIFELYATGKHSARSIEKYLYEKGYRNTNGNKINNSTIKNILQNPKYKGFYCGNKVKIVDYRTKEQKFLDKDEWVMYKDETGETIPAIVSEEIWDECNKIYKERSDVVKSRRHSIKIKNVLSGKIICGKDYHKYWRTSYSNSASKGKPIYTWICSIKKIEDTKACESFSIIENDLYKMLSTYFKSMLPDINDYIDDFIKNIYQKTDDIKNDKKIVNKMSVELEKNIAKKEKLLDLYTDDLISKEEFKNRNNNLNERITELKYEIEQLNNKTSKELNHTNEIFEIKDYIEKTFSIKQEDEDVSKEILDGFIDKAIDKIIVTPINKRHSRLEIVLKTGQKGNISYIYSNRYKNTLEEGEEYICRSGQMFKKICPERQMGFTRFIFPKHEKFILTVSAGVIMDDTYSS